MITNYTVESITQILSKESIYTGENLADIDLGALKSLIEENSRQLNKDISELRD